MHIIYEILSSENKLTKCFTAEEIVNAFNRKDLRQAKIIVRFCKHNGLDTLTDKENLNQWLNKHTTQKEVIWFEHCDKRGNFKFKKCSIERLKNEITEANVF